MSIGKNIKAQREFRDMTQKELAARAHILQGQLSAYETDTVVPNIKKLAKIADALGVSVAVLDESLLHVAGFGDSRVEEPQVPQDFYMQEIQRCWPMLSASERAEIAGHASQLVEEKKRKTAGA